MGKGRQFLFHLWLLANVKWVVVILIAFLIFSVVIYCNQDWALSTNIICYFKFWQQPFVVLTGAFVAYTAWVVLGYVSQKSDSRKNGS